MTGFGYNVLGFGGGSSGPDNFSLNFDTSSDQFLDMTNANFGSYDRALFAIQIIIKNSSHIPSV